MAARVAAFAPLCFKVWRSQSQLRVATTAAPISAHEIQHAWDSDFDHFPKVVEFILILIAFITGNSSLEPLIEGLCAQIHVNLR